MISLNSRFLIKCLVLSGLFCAILPRATFAQQQWSVGFWNGYASDPYTSLQWSALTHLYLTTVEPNSDGSLEYEDVDGNYSTSRTTWGPWTTSIISAAHSNGVKVVISLGGNPNWLGATSSAHLSTYVANIMSVVNTYGLDGVDMDWEGNMNYTQEAAFISAMRSALGSSKILSSSSVFNTSFWATQVSSIDRFGVQSYDDYGTGSCSWFNSALRSDTSGCAASAYSVQSLTTQLINAGVPASKVLVGLAFYGYTVSGPSSPRQSGSRSANAINYNRIAANYASSITNPTFDTIAEAPWFPISGGYLTYDNAQSLTDKVNYAKTNGLGGWMIWNLDQDYRSTQSPSHPLLAAVGSAMGGSSGAETAPSITSTSPLSTGTVGTAYSLTVSSSGSTPMTWALTSGALPSGLSLNSSNGVISGMPTTAASSSFTVEASNAMGNSSRQFSLTVNPKSTTASWFKLVSKNSGMCLDVPGASTTENVQLQQYTCGTGDNQKFQFTPVTGGYKITAKNSGLQMNVRGGSSATQNGAAIIQWPYSGSSNEIWTTVPNVDGSYSITVLSSNKCADVTGSSTSAGAPIQQWQCTGGANQKWSLVPVQ